MERQSSHHPTDFIEIVDHHSKDSFYELIGRRFALGTYQTHFVDGYYGEFQNEAGRNGGKPLPVLLGEPTEADGEISHSFPIPTAQGERCVFSILSRPDSSAHHVIVHTIREKSALFILHEGEYRLAGELFAGDTLQLRSLKMKLVSTKANQTAETR